MLKKISLLGGALACACLYHSTANAESWIPISFGNITIAVPQVSFSANKLTESSYQLTWTAQTQNDAVSYKIERLSLKSVTEDEINTAALPTEWEHVADTSENSFTVNHDITSFDLGGHQTYRLSMCDNSDCNELATVNYFIESKNISETIPQNFTLTEAQGSSFVLTDNLDVKLISGFAPNRKAGIDDAENPFAFGKGFSMLTGHNKPEQKEDLSLFDNVVKKGKDLLGLNRNQATQTNQVTLSWNPVHRASHYVIVRSVIKEHYPTKSFLNNSDLRDWASQTSYTYELVGGEYEFKVYACFDKYENDAINGYCGSASSVLSKSYTSTPDTRYQPTDVKFSVSNGKVGKTQSFDLTWNAPPVLFDNGYLSFKEYRIAGELSGYLGIFNLNDEARLTRNAGTVGAPYLPPGRQYCYKVLPIYMSNQAEEFKGEPGYPAPYQCMTVGDEPPIEAPSYLSILDQPGVEGNYGIGYHYTWGAVKGAQYYQLDINKPYGSANWEPLYIGPNRTFQQIITSSQNIGVRVSACMKEKGFGGVERCGNYRRLYFWAEGKNYDDLPEYRAPSCLMVPERVENGETIEVKWCEPLDSSVSRYEIVEKSNGTVANDVPSSFERTNQNVLKFDYNIGLGEYCFDVIAHYDADGKSFEAGEQCGNVSLPAPIKPTLSVLDAFNADYQLTWTAVTAATSYQIERANCQQSCSDLTESDWSVIHTSYAGTSAQLRNNPGGKLAFRLSACLNNVCSQPSDYVETESRVIRFIHSDNLGTPVVETDQNGDEL